ncbi:MAG: hypothetical protein M3Z17_11835, partial [Gemmatimonadota bacterium]|nr:hypothetical protein [Gemmatimonadota bacterium]
MKKLAVVFLSLVPAAVFAQNKADTAAVRPVASSPSAGSTAPTTVTSATHASATVALAIRVLVPPVLDGKTDDAAWKNAQVIDQFLEYDPK